METFVGVFSLNVVFSIYVVLNAPLKSFRNVLLRGNLFKPDYWVSKTDDVFKSPQFSRGVVLPDIAQADVQFE